MALLQKRARRKASGGRYKSNLTKRLNNLGNLPRHTKIGEKVVRNIRVMGGHKKEYLLSDNIINVYDKKEKKYKKVKLLTVVKNPANRHFIRRNIITKGAIVKTEIGDVKITSRPGQEGSLNGVLV